MISRRNQFNMKSGRAMVVEPEITELSRFFWNNGICRLSNVCLGRIGQRVYLTSSLKPQGVARVSAIFLQQPIIASKGTAHPELQRIVTVKRIALGCARTIRRESNRVSGFM